MSVQVSLGPCVDSRYVGAGSGGLSPHVLNYHSDVNVPSPNDGDVLTYNAASGVWEAAPGGGGSVDGWRIIDADGDTWFRVSDSATGDTDTIEGYQPARGTVLRVDGTDFRITHDAFKLSVKSNAYNPSSGQSYFVGETHFRNDDGVGSGFHYIATFYRTDPAQGNAGFAAMYGADGTDVTHTILYAPGARDFALTTYKGGVTNWLNYPSLYIKDGNGAYGGMIGINTKNPQYPFDLYGEGGADIASFWNNYNFSLIRVEAANAGVGSTGIRMYHGGTEKARAGYDDRYGYYFVRLLAYSATEELLYLTDGGRMGLRTSNPSATLHVKTDENAMIVETAVGDRSLHVDVNGHVSVGKSYSEGDPIAGFEVHKTFATAPAVVNMAQSLGINSNPFMVVDAPTEDVSIDLPDAGSMPGVEWDIRVAPGYDYSYRVYLRATVAGQIEDGQDEWDLSYEDAWVKVKSTGDHWLVKVYN